MKRKKSGADVAIQGSSDAGMIYQPFLEKRLRRLAVTMALLVLSIITAIAMFALHIVAFNASGAGGMAVPFAFACVVLCEVVRYFFYRSYFLQQLSRFAAWKQELNGNKT
ncbi:hypothetical protein [Undibacterium sp. TS12]|uniref:hypothetical protein n=1 Tax=Undibacterium sp. TS12 TaxID=2908202 RepID=UPI001F4CD35C|nr:hypothetical protein [Undibacterium sp. TS12]MCH8621260.1 hypothetical protein [Undibacterium sp. TS12]